MSVECLDVNVTVNDTPLLTLLLQQQRDVHHQLGQLTLAVTRLHARMEKLMADLDTELQQEDDDVNALIAKDKTDVADRDTATAALKDAQDKLNSGTILTADEKAKLDVTAKALHAYLNPAPVPPPVGTPPVDSTPTP